MILEYVAGKGSGHIREIHLAVVELRPEVPQHTVRARLSEMSRGHDLAERLAALGNGFYGLYRENRELCSVVSCPERGPWGNAGYRGNCSGWLVKDLMVTANSPSPPRNTFSHIWPFLMLWIFSIVRTS